MEEYKLFLEYKYGSIIVGELLTNDFRVNLDNEKSQGKGQDAVNEQMIFLSKEGFIEEKEYLKHKDWAFDFPGWIGKLDPKGKNVMIVGLEPHIQNNDYQVIYGLGERIKAKFNSNHFIWERLQKLLYPELDIQEAANNFYITDLCHFAPKGDANRIKQVSEWSKIRKKIAEEFLKKEIDFICPKIILAQGSDSVKALKSILKLDYKINWIKTGYKRPARYGISIGKFNESIVVGIPHLGSEHNLTFNFWKRELSTVRNVIKNHNK